MKTMGHKIQTRIIAGALVFVMMFASIVSAGLSVNGDFGDFLNALGFGTNESSSSNLAINTTSPNYDFVTDKGNWGYEIEKTTGLVLDGVRDNAYTSSGVTIASGTAAGYNPSPNGSTFTVSFAADAKNVYVLYEFTKKEEIFFDEAYASGNWHHFDLAEFNVNLDAKEGTGKSIHFLGGVEGDKTKAKIHPSYPNSPADTGVSNWYVKHTDKGYNVEFTIPLSKITGLIDGNKAISFTALSTITTAYTSGSAPTRTYAGTECAAGKMDKAKPSTLVIKDGACFTTAEGNYGFEIVKSNTALVLDGKKDAAYTSNGLTLEAVNSLPPTEKKSTFNVSFAADNTYAYVLYEFTKYEKIFVNPSGGANYKFDCANFVIHTGAVESSKAYKEFRIGFDKDFKPSADGFIATASDYTVVKGEGNNYSVEFRIPLTSITGVVNNSRAYTFMATATVAYGGTPNDDQYTDTTGKRRNPYPITGISKDKGLSTIVIKDASNSVSSSDDIGYSNPDYVLDAGARYGYYLYAADGTFKVDGLKDDLYKSGLKFKNAVQREVLGFAATPDAKNTFDVYVGADDKRVAILWEFTDNNIVVNGHNVDKDGKPIETTYYNYYNDAAQFVIGKDGRANAGGGATIDYGTGPRGGYVTYDGLTVPYMVVKTEKGFNVEISFLRSQLTNKDVFSFLGLSTIASDDTHRTYGHMTNAINSAENEVKEYISQFQIIDDVVMSDSEYDEVIYDAGSTQTEARWKYYLEQTEATLVNDGKKDNAYTEGLSFGNAYNRDNKPHKGNSYRVYLAADSKTLGFFYEITDPNIVTTSSANGTHRDDCIHFRMEVNGGLVKGTPNSIVSAKGGTRSGTFTAYDATFNYNVVITDTGYNVEITVPRNNLKNKNLFSFVGAVSFSFAPDLNTYSFTATTQGTAQDAALSYANLFEIVDNNKCAISDIYTNISAPVAGTAVNANPANTPSSKGDGYDQYTAYKSPIELDGFKDDAYANAAHFYGDLADGNGSMTGKTGFDAYVAYGADGLIYIYVDVYDEFVAVPDELWSKTNWHTDCFDIYAWHGASSTTRGTYSVSAPENGVSNRVPSGKKQPISVKKRLTPNGWAFEATIKFNDTALLEGGETIGLQFFYNNLWKYTDLSNYGKYTVTNPNQNYPDVYMNPNTVDNEYESMNRVTFSASAAPASSTDVFTSMKNDPTKVAIVYPKETTDGLLNLIKYPAKGQATGDDTTGVNSEYYATLRPLCMYGLPGAAVLEEGDAKIANYTYKVLVGHVNSYAETKAMVDMIGYGGYGVGVFGNTVSVIAPTEQTLAKAVQVLKDELSGNLAAKTLYSGTATAVAGNKLPYLADIRLVSDSGFGTYQLIKNTNVTVEDFNTYCDGLLAAGYKLHSSNVMGGHYLTKTFYNSTDIVTVSYGLHYSSYFDINGTNKITQTMLDATEDSLRVHVSSRAVYSLPTINVEPYTPTTESVFVQLSTRSSNLCDIVRLDNGEFLIFDSAHYNNSDDIMSELLALSNGEKPVIAGWFITHFHQDHIGGLVGLTNLEGISDKVEIKNVVFNLGSEQTYSTAWYYRGNQPSSSDKRNMENFLRGLQNCGTNIVFGETGQFFNFGNSTVEILNTYSDSQPMNITVDSTNRTNSLYALTLRADQDNQYDKVVLQKFIITGDSSAEQLYMAYKRLGSYLKADFLQLPHHGYGEYGYLDGTAKGTAGYTATNSFYTAVDPSYIIISWANSNGTAGRQISELPASEKDFVNSLDAEAGEAYINNNGKTLRLLIPYATKGNFTYDNIGVGPDSPDYVNTSKGTADEDDGVKANANDKVTLPYGSTGNGSYLYVANTAYTDITVDGVMDDIYTYGIHLQGNRNNNRDVTYDVYLIAGQDGYIHVFYNVKDTNRHNYEASLWDGAKTNYAYRQDGVDFWFGFDGSGTLTKDIRIVGKNSSGTTRFETQKKYWAGNNAAYFGAGKAFDNFAIVENEQGYTAELVITKDGAKFENGDMMTFAPLVNSIISFTDRDTMANLTTGPDTVATSTYGTYYAPNAANQQGVNNVLVFSSASAVKAAEAKAALSASNEDICVNPDGTMDLESAIVGSVIANNATPSDTDIAGGAASPQKIYGINTVYNVPTVDGIMDNIYTYGLYTESAYASNASLAEKYPHSYKAWMVYAEDGLMHVFIEVKDEEIILGAEKQYMKDSIHFYYCLGNNSIVSDTFEFDADPYSQTTGNNTGKAYKVVLTEDGYNIEFAFDRNGVPFRPGDVFEYCIYQNAICDGSGDKVNNPTRYNIQSASYWAEERANYYSYFENKGMFSSPNGGNFGHFDGIKILSTNSATADIKDVDHNYVGGVCDKCGNECEHPDHTTAAVCTVCGETVEHNYVDGVCDVCESECAHADHNQDGTCKVCGETVDHSYIEGVCDICDYKCGHADHNQDGICTVCKHTVNHVYTNGVCDVCEYVCGHVNHDTTGDCLECDVVVNHTFVGGVCDNCGKACEHRFGKDHVCDICSVEAPTFANAQLYLTNDISIYFNVNASAITEDYTFSKVVFEFNGETFEITELPEVNEAGQYVFEFAHIVPKRMGDIVTAKIYTEYNGKEVLGKVVQYSVSAYCYNQLSKLNLSSPTNEQQALRTLLVDLLNYGAADQIFAGYNVENLVNANLTDTQKAWATQATPTYENHLNKEARKDGDTAEWKSGTLILDSAITLGFEFVLDEGVNIEDVKVVMTTDGNTTGWTATEFELVNAAARRYRVRFDTLNPYQIRDKVYLTIYNTEDVAISGALTYSIVTYAARNAESTVANLPELIEALVKYGDAVAAYEKVS